MICVILKCVIDIQISIGRMAEWSKALRSGRNEVNFAWVRIPLLPICFFFVTKYQLYSMCVYYKCEIYLFYAFHKIFSSFFMYLLSNLCWLFGVKLRMYASGDATHFICNR